MPTLLLFGQIRLMKNYGAMKFSLKHLIFFVTFAALLCGVISFAYTRVRVVQAKAMQALQMAEAARHEAEEARRNAEHEQWKRLSQAGDEAIRQFGQTGRCSILHWNINSSGQPATIARRLIGLGRYDIVGLSNVDKPEFYEQAIRENWPGRYEFLRGSDNLMMFYDQKKFRLIKRGNLKRSVNTPSSSEKRHGPMFVRLEERTNHQELIVTLSHLTRDDAELRAEQAGDLRDWAQNQALPVIAIGEFNFDYDFKTEKGDAGFDEFVQGGVWKLIKPTSLIDIHSAEELNGHDRFPESTLNFSFVTGAAKNWKIKSREFVRDSDSFDEKTVRHRPVELFFTVTK